MDGHGCSHVHGRGEHVVGGLAPVNVVIGVDLARFAALAAGCTLDKCAAECRSLSEHEELFAEIRTDEAAELHEMTSPTDEAEYADENDPEEGASTAEYGIVMLAAVGFAGLLVAILKSDEIRGMLVDMVKNALATGGSGLTFGLF